MLDVHRIALWMPMSMPGARTHYYRLGAGEYSVRPVLRREYNRYTRKAEFTERWALFKGKYQVHELLPMDDRDACIERAENWLMEAGEIV